MLGAGQQEIGAVAGSETVIDGLRQATAQHHQAIEALLRLDQPFALPHYVRVLQGFEAFLSHWEPAVAQALPPHLQSWFGGRSRLPLVQRDLAVLRTPQTPQAAQKVHVASAAAAFGAMYVIEGSALGGQVISRGLASRHGLGPSDGAAYFHGWGQETGARWKQFRAMLEDEVGTDAQSRRDACGAAVATFDALTTTFRSLLDAPAAA